MNAKQCPACGTPFESAAFRCKDHSVSGEWFDILVCRRCGFASTEPQPSPETIGKYYASDAYVSHSDTRKGIVNKLYHLVRMKNVADKVKIVARLLPEGGELADTGCGTGYFLAACARRGWKIEGVEPDSAARSLAESRIGKPLFRSLVEAERAGRRFDVITLWHVFEHLHDPNASIAQLKRLLKPGGVLILALPDRLSDDAIHYGEHWAAYDVPRHLSHFTPVALRLLAERHGFSLENTIPMKFDAYYVSMLSEGLKGVGGTRAFINGLIRGTRSNRKAARNGNYSSLIFELRIKN
jgi:SAM-dependent methyltransferase